MTVTRLRDVPAQMLASGPMADAAKRLAKSLGNPRQHSVWVRSELGPEEFTETGEPRPRQIVPVICVALHPKFGAGVSVPATWESYAVREEPWG